MRCPLSLADIITVAQVWAFLTRGFGGNHFVFTGISLADFMGFGALRFEDYGCSCKFHSVLLPSSQVFSFICNFGQKLHVRSLHRVNNSCAVITRKCRNFRSIRFLRPTLSTYIQYLVLNSMPNMIGREDFPDLLPRLYFHFHLQAIHH